MKIEDSGGIRESAGLFVSGWPRKEAAAPEVGSAGRDRIEIERNALAIQRLRDVEEASRSEKVQHLREAVQSRAYRVDADGVSGKIIDETIESSAI